MNFSSGASQKPEQDYFSCSGFRTKKKICTSSHFIRRTVLEQVVLEAIQKVTTFAAKHENMLVERLETRNTVKLAGEIAADKKRLAQAERRIKELDEIIRQLFEKNALGVISNERFITLSAGYEQEQKDLKINVEILLAQTAEQLEASTNINKFIAQIRKYTRVTELTPIMLNELIERVEVYARSERYSKGVQSIVLHFNYVGIIDDTDLQPTPTAKKQAHPQMEAECRPPVMQPVKIPVMATLKG